MSEKCEAKQRRGPVTVLTLLFGLLLGTPAAGAQLQVEPGTARAAPSEVIRSGAALRIARSGEEKPDADDALALLPPPPRLATELAFVRPMSPAADADLLAADLGRHVPYQARAPPAA